MNDELRASYDAIPYHHGAVLLAHPARLGAIARLLGRRAAPPDRCRVLELGCGIGGNLLPAAAQLPGSEFVGVDFSPAQIATAENAREAAGITNARLMCADLREFECESGSFDYVIAHGVYSWVPVAMRAPLLARCADALAPEGVAYVSYNTQPAWGLLGGLREVLRSQLAPVADPIHRAAHAKRLLTTLAKAFAPQKDAYSVMMRELLAEMLAKPLALTMHDELGLENHPVTFADFTADAAGHGLHFLAEAHYASMPLDHLPQQTREALAELQPDAMQAQQYLDLLGNRRFRASLLTRTPADAALPLDAAAIRECAVATHLRPDALHVHLAKGEAMQVSGRHGVRFAVREPSQKAFLGALMAAAPERVPFAKAISSADALLTGSGIVAGFDEDALCHAVARLFTIDQVDLMLAGDGAWLAADTTATTALRAHCAAERLPSANRWHEAGSAGMPEPTA